MAHDVFISHSSSDKLTADATVAALEAHGLRCWVAPRDVIPGVQWANAIVQAITECRLMVLVFSSDANDSHHIVREVELAAHHRKPIIPLRVENVVPSPTLDYYIAGTHWLDAMDPPLEAHLERLSSVVKDLLDQHPRAERAGEPIEGVTAATLAGSAQMDGARADAAAGQVAVLAPQTPSSSLPPVVLTPLVTPTAPHDTLFLPAPPLREVATPATTPPPSPRRKGLIFLLAGVILLAAVGTAAAVLPSGDDEVTTEPAASPSAQVESPSPSEPTGPTAVETATVRPPQRLHTGLVSAGEVRLLWERAPFGAAVDHFVVLRDGEQVATVQERSYIDEDVAPSHTYVYRIVVVGVDGSKASSREIEVTTPAAPTPPSNSPPTSSGNPPPACDGVVTPSGECIPWS